MINVDKLPRWFLILLSSFGIAACCLLASNAKGDMDKIKSVAYQAQISSDKNADAVADFKDAVKDIRVTQEQFRREYREDKKETDLKLMELLKAIKQ